jgi:hypothetical protein
MQIGPFSDEGIYKKIIQAYILGNQIMNLNELKHVGLHGNRINFWV